MKSRSIISCFILLLCACLDRVNIDTGITTYPVVVDGNISDQPGPYEITVRKSFDIESKISTRADLSVKRMVMYENTGKFEELTEARQGLYRTSVSGMRGVVGRAYWLRIELLDGRIYESIPDTLQPTGKLDSVYHTFKSEKDSKGTTQYGFDVFFNSGAGNRDSYYYMWKFVGTYKVDTNPELFVETCGESTCPKPRPCSAYIYQAGRLQEVKPCECCTCWVNFYNDNPIVSDNQFVEGGNFRKVRLGYVPLDQWMFMYKVHVEARQMSLSRSAFKFWKGVQAQKQASTSLFQPVTGKLTSNYVQVSGQPGPMEGLFFATAISTRSAYITRNAVPKGIPIPVRDLPFKDSCLSFGEGKATLAKPVFWTD